MADDPKQSPRYPYTFAYDLMRRYATEKEMRESRSECAQFMGKRHNGDEDAKRKACVILADRYIEREDAVTAFEREQEAKDVAALQAAGVIL